MHEAAGCRQQPGKPQRRYESPTVALVNGGTLRGGNYKAGSLYTHGDLLDLVPFDTVQVGA